MPNIRFNHHTYLILKDESVLDTLLKQGVNVAHTCKTGVCQSCLLQATQGSIPARAQQGLKATQVAQNYLLACVCYPETDMDIQPIDSTSATHTAQILASQLLNSTVKQLQLACPTLPSYKAGQFINLHHPNGTVRSYSLASIPSDGYLELQVKRIESGVFSGWIHDQLKVGDEVRISVAIGHCFYTAQDRQQPLLMIGTGTGLAPLIGIVRDALSQGHQGEIYLYHGSHDVDGLYAEKILKELTQRYPNLHYTACVSGSNSHQEITEHYTHGRASNIALSRHHNLSGWKVFLCGNANMVKDTRHKAFLAKASMQDIFADPFEFI